MFCFVLFCLVCKNVVQIVCMYVCIYEYVQILACDMYVRVNVLCLLCSVDEAAVYGSMYRVLVF